jgi:hypothetical protein
MALTNNDIFKKLRVAHKLRDTDIIKICRLVDYDINESRLNAFFRAEDHPKYMNCGDQVLRNFLNGLVIHLRGPMEPKAKTDNPKPRAARPDRGAGPGEDRNANDGADKTSGKGLNLRKRK